MSSQHDVVPGQHMPARSFVLVHGAWHGGWCWRRVADILESQGHKVFTPTLTGLGERWHLMHHGINLDTHITDVVNVFEFEEVENAILCGHSYGGWVISGAVERVRSRVSAIVFLDAHVPHDGESGSESSNSRTLIEAELSRRGTGLQPRSAEYFGVNERDRAWVDSKLTPQPIGVSQQPIRLTGARESIQNKTFIRTKRFPSGTFDVNLRAAKEAGWRVHEIDAGHDLMIDEPDLLAQLLLRVAAG